MPCAGSGVMFGPKKVPKGVICLLSALQYHELTTQLPHQVWVAIPEKAHVRGDWPGVAGAVAAPVGA